MGDKKLRFEKWNTIKQKPKMDNRKQQVIVC